MDVTKRKCFKCGCSPAEHNVKLFRFPKPGDRNLMRCMLWAKYIFPEGQYNSLIYQTKLYNDHRMLCEKHFQDADFKDITKAQLLRTAVPCDVSHSSEYVAPSPSQPVQPGVPGTSFTLETCCTPEPCSIEVLNEASTHHDAHVISNTGRQEDSPISSHNPFPTNEETMPSTIVLENINSSLDAIAQCLGHIKSGVEEIKYTQNDILLRISSPSSTKVHSAATFPVEIDMPMTSLDDLRKLKQTQNDTLLRISSPSSTKVSSAATFPVEIDMPMTTFDDVRNIENRLEEEEYKEKLINILSYVDGKGTDIITRKVLQRVFTNSLAIHCNWTGKNNKFSLKNLQLIKVIIAAVRRNKVAETATEAEITRVITNWFRFAGDRNGGRENRRTR